MGLVFKNLSLNKLSHLTEGTQEVITQYSDDTSALFSLAYRDFRLERLENVLARLKYIETLVPDQHLKSMMAALHGLAEMGILLMPRQC